LTPVLALFHNPRYQVFRLSPHNSTLPFDIANDIFATNAAVSSCPGFILPLKPDYNPDDTYWGNQWYFRNTGQFGGPADVDIDLDGAYDYNMLSSDTIVVAMIDNGLMS